MTHHAKVTAALLPLAILVYAVGGADAQPVAESSEAPYAQQYESHITIRADHSSTDVITQRFKILTQTAIEAISQQKLHFVEGLESLETVEAYTEKPDGRRLPVGPKNILTQDAPPQQVATYARDLKERTIIFPDVTLGDTLVMTNKWETARRLAFTNFADSKVFPRSLAFTSVKIDIEAPASLGLQVKAIGKGAVDSATESGGTSHHAIVIVPEPYAPEEAGAVSPLDRDPAVLMSTYASYQELGAGYGKNALPKAAITPAIAAQANAITRGITDRLAQAMAIDAWMKKNIRYVAVLLSTGRIIPNDASTVLKNKFGDCKDKTTLMAALLAAKGIASEPALINLGNTYTLPEPPTYAALNHVILYLPEFDRFDDPTASHAAFGVLLTEAYDKPVVRVTAQGAVLAHTPSMIPEDHTANVKTTLDVAADGSITGRTEEHATGVLATQLRTDAGAVQTLGDEAAARRRLQSLFTPGTGHFELGGSADTTDPVTIVGSFKLDDRFKPPALGGRAVIPRGMALLPRPESFLLGSRLTGRKAAFVCFAGRHTEDIEASFDAAWPMPLPFPPARIDNQAFSFQSTMKIEGRTLKIHQEFVSRVRRQVCPAELEAQIVADLNAVRSNVYTTFAFGNRLLAPATTQPASIPVPSIYSVNNSAIPAFKPPSPPQPRIAQNAPATPGTAAQPQIAELPLYVAAGHKIRIGFLVTLDPDCSSVGQTVVRVLEQPQHGKFTVEDGQGFSSFPADNPRSVCNTHKSEGTFIYYEPDEGFTGTDSVSVDILYPSGGLSKRHYAIKVE